MMKQKFEQLSFVHISADLPFGMSHFKNDFDGIEKMKSSILPEV